MIRLTFDGAPLAAAPGVSLAAALTAVGHRALRRTETGGARGVFCGMGVCQDCLVTVDGRPNRRACMTEARDGMAVETQAPRPPLDAPPPPAMGFEALTPDVLVVGGGAAGLNAAMAAREEGAEVVLLDERRAGGGQYFKQSHDPSARPLDGQQAEGARLLARARAAGPRILAGAEVWGAFDGPEILAADETTSYAIRPRDLVVATGAYERPEPIPGWTLPGVMTVGAAQTLWRSYRTLPGARVAVLGNGPLCSQVALELARGGAEIVLLAEAAPHPMRRAAASALMSRRDPGLAAKGLATIAALRSRRVPVEWGARAVAVTSQDDALAVTWTRGGAERTVTADAVLLNHGFQPQNEILRLLGCAATHDACFDQMRVDRDERMATSVQGVFAAGDCCGLGGAPAAAIEGRIAGRAAAGGAGPTPAETRALARHRAFQAALWRVFEAPPPRMEDCGPDAIVCRCEEVRRTAIDAALEVGATDIGAIKRATRVGMGRCQGRYCASALAGYLSRRTGRPMHDRALFAPRVPIKPVDVAAITAGEDAASADG